MLVVIDGLDGAVVGRRAYAESKATALPRQSGRFCSILPSKSTRSEFLGVLRPLVVHIVVGPCPTSAVRAGAGALLLTGTNCEDEGSSVGAVSPSNPFGMHRIGLCISDLTFTPIAVAGLSNNSKGAEDTVSTSSAQRASKMCCRLLWELLDIITLRAPGVCLLEFVGVGGAHSPDESNCIISRPIPKELGVPGRRKEAGLACGAKAVSHCGAEVEIWHPREARLIPRRKLAGDAGDNAGSVEWMGARGMMLCDTFTGCIVIQRLGQILTENQWSMAELKD